MDKNEAEKVALFRYGLIARAIHEEGRGQMKYFGEIAKKEYLVPGKPKKKSYGVSTLKLWLHLYRKNGIESLYPSTRNDAGTTKKIAAAVQAKIKELIEDFPNISGAGIYRTLIKQGVITKYDFTEATLRNYISVNSLREKKGSGPGRRKFEMPKVNMLWTADFLHGPYIKDSYDHGKKKKTYLCGIIDDHSRLIVGGRFFFHEDSLALATVIKAAILQYGLPQKLYCDNGAVFSTSYLNLACARTGIALIHSKPYDSPSRGKIERFFRTVRQMFLVKIGKYTHKSLEILNADFRDWLHDEYHLKKHSSIKQPPKERFLKSIPSTDIKRIAEHELNRSFYQSYTRKVRNDSTVSINGIQYELPLQLIGSKVELRAPLDKPKELTLFIDNEPECGVEPVNPIENAQKPHTSIHFSDYEKGKDDDTYPF